MGRRQGSEPVAAQLAIPQPRGQIDDGKPDKQEYERGGIAQHEGEDRRVYHCSQKTQGGITPEKLCQFQQQISRLGIGKVVFPLEVIDCFHMGA